MERADPRVVAVPNETTSSATRVTKDGKTITYRMVVLQQPVRARACGAGAKSSADRRPVDPPPIVELRIFEGEGTEMDKEITFTLNANYFLFATLEQARPMAQGRLPAERVQQATVLTGTPVAGMVYLDRPQPAGYFIFPDLSVRHEGKYRLGFSLYEELKEIKDEDSGEEQAVKTPGAGETHVTHRLEVRSEPFVVYSAKKFPGLTESTSLSRTVAEQGCRVRIRRDVRMRRRDPKVGKEWEVYEAETAKQRAKHSTTPDAYGGHQLPTPYGSMDPIPRPRSASNTSHQSIVNSASRRPSLHEIPQTYHCASYSSQGDVEPQTPQRSYAQQSPYGPSPSQQFQPQPVYPQQQAMQPPSTQYQPPSYQQHPSIPPPQPQHSYYNYAPPPPPQQQYAPATPHYEPAPPQQQHRPSVDYSHPTAHEYHRPSVHQMPPQQPTYTPLPQQTYPPLPPQYPSQLPQQQQPSFNSQPMLQQAPYGSMSSYGSQPPAPSQFQPPSASSQYQPPSAPSQYQQPPPPIGRALTPVHHSLGHTLPPINTTLGIPVSNLEPSSPGPAAPQSNYYSSVTTPVETTGKRSYGDVFPTVHLDQPLRSGARPGSPIGSTARQGSFTGASGVYAAADDDDVDLDADPTGLKMQYRRADGRRIARLLPQSN